MCYILLENSCGASKCSHCSLLLLLDWINSIYYYVLCSGQCFPVVFFKWMRWPLKIFHILQLTTRTILYKFNFQEFKNQYTSSAFIAHSRKKTQTLSWAGCVWVLCHISQPQKELITGILGALMASPAWCSLSKVHPAISWAWLGGAKQGRTQFFGAGKTKCWAEAAQRLLCIPAMRRYMHHYRSCLYLCEVIEFYWEI